MGGHFLNDYVANRYTRTHNNIFKPECRLYTYFLAAFLMIVSRELLCAIS